MSERYRRTKKSKEKPLLLIIIHNPCLAKPLDNLCQLDGVKLSGLESGEGSRGQCLEAGLAHRVVRRVVPDRGALQ